MVPSAQGCSGKFEGCVYRFDDTSGELSRKSHRNTGESSFTPIRQEARRIGDLTSRPATSLGVPIAHVCNGRPLVVGGRSTLCAGLGPSLRWHLQRTKRTSGTPAAHDARAMTVMHAVIEIDAIGSGGGGL